MNGWALVLTAAVPTGAIIGTWGRLAARLTRIEARLVYLERKPDNGLYGRR